MGLVGLAHGGADLHVVGAPTDLESETDAFEMRWATPSANATCRMPPHELWGGGSVDRSEVCEDGLGRCLPKSMNTH